MFETVDSTTMHRYNVVRKYVCETCFIVRYANFKAEKERVMKKWRVFWVLSLSVALVLGACSPAGGGQAPAAGGDAPPATGNDAAAEDDIPVAGDDTAAAEDDAPARIELTKGANNWNFDTHESWWPTDFHTWIEDQLGINLTLISMDQDQTNLALAARDLPDLFMVPTARTVLDAGLALPLDPFLDTYGNYIQRFTTRNEFVRRFMSDDSGQLFFRTANAGGEDVTGGTALWSGNLVRWDLFLEIGAPPINNDQDYINALLAMREIYPTTEAGLPVFGMGVHNDWGLWGWLIRGFAVGGYSNMGGWAYYTSTRCNTADIGSSFTNPTSPFFQSMRFFNQMHRHGLLDPDSFIMNWDEVGAKATARQYLGGYTTWNLGGMYDAAREQDPDTNIGFMSIPGEGISGWFGQNAPIGWGDRLQFVFSGSDHPELAVQYLNLLDSPLANRINYSGQQDIHWDYVDGAPRLFDSTIELRAAGGDAWRATGIDSWGNFVGYSAFGVHPDGHFMSLWDDVEIKSAALNPLERHFSEHFGVRYPAEVMYNLVNEGRAYNQRYSMHTTVSAGVASVPPDVERIDNAMNDLALRTIPDFVLASTDEEFEAVAESFISNIMAIGHDEAWTWWQTEWNYVRDFVRTIMP